MERAFWWRGWFGARGDLVEGVFWWRNGLVGGVLDVEGAFGGRGVLVKAVFRWRGLFDGWKGCFGGGNVVD